MTTLEDILTDEELDDIEDAKQQAKREKTKYGDKIDSGDE